MTTYASPIPIPAATNPVIVVKKDNIERSNFPTRVDEEIQKDDEDFDSIIANLTTQPLPQDQKLFTLTAATPLAAGNTPPALPIVIVAPSESSTQTVTQNVIDEKIIASLTVGTPQLLNEDGKIDIDPRLIATNLSPQDLASFKDKLSQTIQTATQTSPSTALQTPVKSNESAVIPTQSSIDIPVIVIRKPEPSNIVAITSSTAVMAQMAVQMNNVAVGDDAPISPVIENLIAATDILDPAELRVAQKSTRADGPALFTPRTLAQQLDQPAPEVKTYTPNAVVNAAKNDSTPTQMNTNHISANIAVNNDIATPDYMTQSQSSLYPSGLSAPSLMGLPQSSSTAASNILQNLSAVHTHPATQAVANIIQKAARNDGPQNIVLRLDPVELGRMEIRMNYKKGDPLKVHLVVEKADTMAMFQRDQSSLNAALNQAGIKTDGGSLSFELSHDGSAFDQALNDDRGSDKKSSSITAAEPQTVSTDHSLTPILGNAVRYSVLA